DRVISPAFLRAIFVEGLLQAAIPQNGFRLVGAWIKEPIDLTNANLASEFWFEGSRIDRFANMSFMRSSKSVSFDKSLFKKGLRLSFTQVDLISMAGTIIRGK